jgi:6-phosphogluconolactonase
MIMPLIFENPRAAAEACGAETLQLLDQARSARGRAFLAISGGSTPRVMFEWMAAQMFDWESIELFWVDERCVPPDDSQSNYRMTREALLDRVKIEPARIHRIKGELPPAEAASLYRQDIESTFHLAPGELPVFDIIQRGMGPDAHTASLFPGERLIDDRTHIAADVWVEKMKQHRVTLLPGVLEKGRHTLCLATGAEKIQALKDVLTGPEDLHHFPCQIARTAALWYVDRAAWPGA